LFILAGVAFSERTPQDAESRETPFGVLYRPRSFALQIPVLFGAFLGGPAAGWVLAQVLGGVSENGRTVLYISTTSIFFLGYMLWAARLAALAFDAFGKHILRALFLIVVRRQKPQRVDQLLPTREKLEELVVRAQRAASSFFVVSLPIGFISGTLARFLETESEKWVQSIVVAVGCFLWGSILSVLGRRGYLPLPEPAD
jgi:hypothetical protein